MRISDWSSDVCSSDLIYERTRKELSCPDSCFRPARLQLLFSRPTPLSPKRPRARSTETGLRILSLPPSLKIASYRTSRPLRWVSGSAARSEEHTSELQSLMRISYAVFCLKKKKNNRTLDI